MHAHELNGDNLTNPHTQAHFCYHIAVTDFWAITYVNLPHGSSTFRYTPYLVPSEFRNFDSPFGFFALLLIGKPLVQITFSDAWMLTIGFLASKIVSPTMDLSLRNSSLNYSAHLRIRRHSQCTTNPPDFLIVLSTFGFRVPLSAPNRWNVQLLLTYAVFFFPLQIYIVQFS